MSALARATVASAAATVARAPAAWVRAASMAACAAFTCALAATTAAWLLRSRGRQAPLRGLQFALALRQHGLGGLLVACAHRHLRLGAGQGGNGLLVAGLGLGVHGFERVDLHAGQELAGVHE